MKSQEYECTKVLAYLWIPSAFKLFKARNNASIYYKILSRRTEAAELIHNVYNFNPGSVMSQWVISYLLK